MPGILYEPSAPLEFIGNLKYFKFINKNELKPIFYTDLSRRHGCCGLYQILVKHVKLVIKHGHISGLTRIEISGHVQWVIVGGAFIHVAFVVGKCVVH
jgi:hypothetical protein